MNEITQNIKFHKSRLNWDADTSLMGEGESKYFLNTIPEDSEHAGVRTNCLGTTTPTYFINTTAYYFPVTITDTATYSKRFDFTLELIDGAIFEIGIQLDGEQDYVYVINDSYSTLSQLGLAVVTEVRKFYEDSLVSYGYTSGGAIHFIFNTSTPADTDVTVGMWGATTPPTNLSVLGAYYDAQDDVVYYWARTSAPERMYVIRHNCKYNITRVILREYTDSSVKSTTFISNVFTVGSGRDKLLYWCYNGIGTFSINLYNPLVVAAALPLIKSPGLSTSNAVSSTAAVAESNSDKYYLVKHRRVYANHEKSVFSPIYPLAYPSDYGENSVGVRGKLSNKAYSIYTEGTTKLDDVEYAVKQGGGNWHITELPLQTTGLVDITVGLTGAEPTVPIAESDINKLFDYVPQKTGTQCFVNNRIIIGDCTELYDNVDITADITYSKDTSYPSAPTIYLTSAFTGSGPYTTLVTPLTVSATEWKTHCIYVKTAAGKEYFGYVQDDYGMTQVQLCDALVAALAYEVEAGGDSSNVLVSRSSSSVWVISTITGATCRYLVFRSYVKQRTIKRGATPYFGCVFHDLMGRCGGVNPIEAVTAAFDGSYDYPTTADITLTSTTPSWASFAQIYYGGSSLQAYTQAVIKRADIEVDFDVLKIYLDNYVVNSQIINSASQMASYVFTPGDKFVFIGYKSTATTTIEGQTFTYSTFPHFTVVEPLDILSQDESCIYVRKPSNSTLLSQITGCTYAHIEIHTPRGDKPVEYKETSHLSSGYSVIVGGVTTVVNPSFSIALDHIINQTFYIDDGVPVSAWIESESFSNYFESKTLGLGRANFYNPGFKQLRRNIIRASNEYIPNTNINGLSTFDWNDEVAVDEQYGFITDLKMVGNALKIIQPRKISSMYIGAEVGIDASGNQVMFRSDKVLTEPRYGATDFGSMHPESIVPHGSYLYGYDAINSVVWRDTPGGTFAISDNAMRSYFKYKTRQLVASCGYSFKAVGGYDYLNEMYLITFKDPYNSANDETIGFHEPSESWYSFYSFKPEMYCGVPGDYLLSFNGGKLYTHNSATRNNFYSTQYYSEAWVVGNIYPDDTKKWNSLVVNSNDAWSAPEIIVDEDSIAHLDGESYTTHKGKMQSLLNEIHFRIMNGEYRAEFLRDLYTSDPDTITPLDAINGRALTGKTILIKLRNANTIAVYLRGVKVNAQIAR
jgi:hypothetical protein